MKSFSHLLVVLLFTCASSANAQQIHFTPVLKLTGQIIYSIKQDGKGFIWILGSLPNDHCVLQRYNGVDLARFKPDFQSQELIQNFSPACMFIDKENKIWIGLANGGIEVFDPGVNSFTHYRYNAKNASGISSDTVNAIVQDRSGNMWIGTQDGLDVMDKSGKCKHFFHRQGNNKSLITNAVNILYKDRNDNIWIGFGDPFNLIKKQPDTGGLTRFNAVTNSFIKYNNDSTITTGIFNKVTSIAEDNRGIIWIGTSRNHLYSIDKASGVTSYVYNSLIPNALSAPADNRFYPDHITTINQDAAGALWIGTWLDGINRYDPVAKKIMHFGSYYEGSVSVVTPSDTLNDFAGQNVSSSLISKDGLLWLTNYFGFVYNFNPDKTTVPFVSLNDNANANAFYQDTANHALWIGTNKGLIRKDWLSNTEKIWHHNAGDKNSLSNDTISNLKFDNGIFWISTVGGGLCSFDPSTNTFSSYLHNDKNSNSISSNLARNLLIDHNKNIWVGTYNGLDFFNRSTQKFTSYFHNDNDSTSILNNITDNIYEDKNNTIWIGSFGGIDRLEKNGKTFHHYLQGSMVLSFYTDKKGVFWAGTSKGIFSYNLTEDVFKPFVYAARDDNFNQITSILGDNENNLWLRSTISIIKIDAARNKISIYGSVEGVHNNYTWICRNLKGINDELFIGDLGGYYNFSPNRLKEVTTPHIILTGLKLGDKDILPSKNSVLQKPVSETKQLTLEYNQNNFTFSFIGLHYDTPGNENYMVMLQDYDHTWRNLGNDRNASFYDVPSGKYTFRVRAFNSNNSWSEKDISVIILPPWWRRWWAYGLYILFFLAISFFTNRAIRNRIVAKERMRSRDKELEQAKQIEKAYNELKSTQAQLIQSEKMASLGELTAGIAHEIQNPLNFVNNFSEVNKELLAELSEEIDKGNYDDAKTIAKDVIENEEKINHHGKRADAIVKGMLQHSRSSTGQKEPTDINALADEYLRLSFHGLRAKDKSFNADFKTDFDTSLGKINIVPQDIGRVLLNLYNNAFYAVKNLQTLKGSEYKPLVTVTTRSIKPPSGGLGVLLTVSDNGNGIPQNIVDKIFQPFFTTKPTGEGTGLGLSLSYDIIKAHGGEIKVVTKENEGSEFIIQLPLT
jgi:signal transduction histidine kinase/ligand-binding sensor domain-containing protein